jgi:UDP-N-acetylmuramate: L-alanyl-gamma-D-glutamyl-meso-diaminopimelate ligase
VRIHILGICGTFMGSMALIAREMGYEVSGSDANVYPPMSTQLADAGIVLTEGYDPACLDPAPDLVVIGNAMGRGNPAVEYVLNRGLPFMSGPEWFSRHVLTGRHVVAVAGTHGKTTTSSMLAWILEHAGMAPGFLIGGVTGNFASSARLGEGAPFVIEADEYDSAFFDKRSKFVHYRPRTLVLNNLEYDHADIFPDLEAIQRQFHHLVRTVPSGGKILCAAGEPALAAVLAMGCWTPVEHFGPGADAGLGIAGEALDPPATRFRVTRFGEPVAEVAWACSGMHNLRNGLAAIAGAVAMGVTPVQACEALCAFRLPKRRMERIGQFGQIEVYDDFAHHPTAIRLSLEGMRARVGARPVWVVVEPRSNTMKMGVHQGVLAASCAEADQVIWYAGPGLDWDLQAEVDISPVPAALYRDVDSIVDRVVNDAPADAIIIVMSNGGFDGIHKKLLAALNNRTAKT